MVAALPFLRTHRRSDARDSGHRDAGAGRCASPAQPLVAHASAARQIYASAHGNDGDGCSAVRAAHLAGRQWYHDGEAHLRLSSARRQAVDCPNHPHDGRVLELCADVRSRGISRAAACVQAAKATRMAEDHRCLGADCGMRWSSASSPATCSCRFSSLFSIMTSRLFSSCSIT